MGSDGPPTQTSVISPPIFPHDDGLTLAEGADLLNVLLKDPEIQGTRAQWIDRDLRHGCRHGCRHAGLRIALGAQRPEILRFVLKQGLRPLLWGTLLGLLPCVVLALVAVSEVFRDQTVQIGDVALVGGVVSASIAIAGFQKRDFA